MSVFFSDPIDSVKTAIETRKSFYGQQTRNTDALNWLYKKMAYAEVTARGTKAVGEPENEPVKISLKVDSKTFGIPFGGGIDSAFGLYRNEKTSKNETGIVPKPHLVSVKLSAEGDFGSIIKCTVAFAVYSLAQLEDHLVFLTLGNTIDVKYGWSSVNKAVAGPDGNFSGRVTNFSYSLNEQGGFDCTLDCIGEGTNVLDVTINAAASNNDKAVITDAKSTTQTAVNTIYTRLYYQCKKYVQTKGTSKSAGADKTVFDPIQGVGQFEFATAEKNTSNSQRTSNIIYYTTLQNLVDVINEYVLKSSFAKKEFLPLLTIDQDWKEPEFVEKLGNILSANPEILWPTHANYQDPITASGAGLKTNTNMAGRNKTIKAGTGKWKNLNGQLAAKGYKLGDFTISLGLIKNLIDESDKENKPTGKSRENSLSNFFEKLFIKIKEATGGIVKLTLTLQQPTILENNKEIIKFPQKKMVINDTANVFLEDKQLLELTGVTQNGICRTASVVTKIPNEMAISAFVAATAASTQVNSATKDILGIQDTTASDIQAKADEALTAAGDEYNKAWTALVFAGPSQQNISSLSAALEKYVKIYLSTSADLTSKQKPSIPFPIEFSCTLDGIHGFKFGDTITFNYLPSIYKMPSSRIAFTITKVDQDISGNDWITTLNTVCRLV